MNFLFKLEKRPHYQEIKVTYQNINMAPRLTNRSEKRKNATEREKARMEKMNQDIDYIQAGFQMDIFQKHPSLSHLAYLEFRI